MKVKWVSNILSLTPSLSNLEGTTGKFIQMIPRHYKSPQMFDVHGLTWKLHNELNASFNSENPVAYP